MAQPNLQDEVAAHLEVLRQVGPALGRPRVDTLKGSKLPAEHLSKQSKVHESPSKQESRGAEKLRSSKD